MIAITQLLIAFILLALTEILLYSFIMTFFGSEINKVGGYIDSYFASLWNKFWAFIKPYQKW